MMHKVEGLSDFVVFCIFHFLMYANDGIEKRSEILLKIQNMRLANNKKTEIFCKKFMIGKSA